MKHLQDATDAMKLAVPAGFTIHDFATIVARTLVDEYGEHNIERFMNTLTNEINTQTT